jgi:hypothetical protein
MVMSCLYSKLPETGVSPHIGTGGERAVAEGPMAALDERYYLERRDPDFAEKMAEVPCVYRRVKILKKAAGRVEEEAE